MIKKLKDPELLKKKPELKLKPNHYRFVSVLRFFDPEKRGQAIVDGRGWYK